MLLECFPHQEPQRRASAFHAELPQAGVAGVAGFAHTAAALPRCSPLRWPWRPLVRADFKVNLGQASKVEKNLFNNQH